jgi:hypothetical protein
LLTGLLAANERGFDTLIALDADGQHHPEDLPILVAAQRQTPQALIVVARDFDVPNVPDSSKFGRNFSNFWVRFETGLDLDDTQSGYRVYPVAQTLALGIAPSYFEFEVEVLVRVAWAGLTVRDIPIRVYYPPPEERNSHYRSFVDSTRISLLHCRLVGRMLLRPVWPIRQIC